LPTIDNQDVREHFEAMRARGVNRRLVLEMTTGGTTGKPTRFLMHRREGQDSERAYIEDMWRRVGYRPGDRRIILRGAVIPGADKGRVCYPDPLLNVWWFSNFHLTEENLGRLVELIRSYRPEFIHTYPSAVTILCQYLERHGIDDLPAPRAVLASSETVYAGQREYVERGLKTRFFSWYGHAEHLALGGECEHCTDYHLFPSYGFCELLEEDGSRQTATGAEGEIVGTGFHNPAMPMIRYRTGDWAEFAGDGCAACGRQYPLIRNVRGHYYQDMIVGVDGRLISTTAINLHDDTFAHVRQYQFHQKEHGSVILKIVPDADFTSGDEARIQAVLKPRLQGLALHLERVEEIPATGRGKWKYLVQELETSLDWLRSRES
jgi:phenylacetate-CoA ligase